MYGNRLRDIRDARGLTQKDLANRVGMSDQQIYRYETDKSDPTGEALAKISKALDVSVDYLLGLVDEPNSFLQESQLSPMEQKLLAAARSGLIVEALKALTAISDKDDKSDISGGKPTVDSKSF